MFTSFIDIAHDASNESIENFFSSHKGVIITDIKQDGPAGGNPRYYLESNDRLKLFHILREHHFPCEEKMTIHELSFINSLISVKNLKLFLRMSSRYGFIEDHWQKGYVFTGVRVPDTELVEEYMNFSNDFIRVHNINSLVQLI